MIEKFTVKNFLSFRGECTISLLPKPIKELPGNLLSPVFTKYSILKSIGVFGINSSGKTNLFKAINFMKEFTLGRIGGVDEDGIRGLSPFMLDKDSYISPSEFEIELWQNDLKYRFGFKINKNKILEEWLFVKETQKEKNIYVRKDSDFRIGRGYKADIEKFIGRVRPNELFINFAARLYLEFAENIMSWFRNTEIIIDVEINKMAHQTIEMLSNALYKHEVESVIKNSGFGIDSITLSKVGDFSTVKTGHKIFDNENIVGRIKFDLFKDESLGTRKYFALLGPILRCLRNGSLLIIDEFDAGFHTILGKHLIKLFNISNTINKNPQMIFSSHNLDLWDPKFLRRDQQLHIEKDQYGKSVSKTTYEFKHRSDKKIKKSYEKNEMVKLPILTDYQLKLDF